MNEQDVIHLLEDSGALLTGHFKLRSGKHSNRFFQAALLLQYPDKAEKACVQLAKKFADMEIETVISPAVGGLIVGQEMGRALKTRAIFADKEDNALVLKRGFSIRPGEKVLVAEDVVTEGGRVKETIALVRSLGGVVAGVAVIVDRSGGKAAFDVPFHSLLQLTLPTYEESECPLCKAGLPVERPGSKL